MAKSMRSKVKRTFRSKKREVGIYAATEAARLNRLNAKLVALSTKDKDGDVVVEDADEGEKDGENIENTNGAADQMELDGGAQSSAKSADARISTHGPRNSRREEWRKSKGLAPRPKAQGANRQGVVVARRKPGRASRRR